MDREALTGTGLAAGAGAIWLTAALVAALTAGAAAGATAAGAEPPPLLETGLAAIVIHLSQVLSY